MAENKKTIVVYADWIKKFEVLTDEEAGKLIKHFFRYVNDQNPIPTDRITEVAFIDIEQSLKRDLVKWEGKKEEKSQNGIIGNLKRWHVDLYEKYTSGGIMLKEALIIAENRKTSGSDTLRQKSSLDIANIAVNVSVNDNVYSKKDIYIRSEDFKNEIRPFVKSKINADGKYTAEMAKAFFEYWSEPDKHGKKLRFEMEKTWSLESRLNRWHKNNFDKNPKLPMDPPRPIKIDHSNLPT